MRFTKNCMNSLLQITLVIVNELPVKFGKNYLSSIKRLA